MSDPGQSDLGGSDDGFALRSTTAVRDAGPLRPQGPFPQRFGRYLVQRRLGGGAMATVYLADDTRLETAIALKVPHPHLLQDANAVDRFYREARIAAKLNHPHLCQVFDVGEQDGTHYIAFRYVEGRPLERDAVATPAEAAELVRKIAAAVAEAHRLGVIHRDLKPANVLVTPGGDPVVTDFGLALRLHADDPRLTHSGVVVGTPLYMAPEQFQGDPEALGPTCDIYSLGVIFYELLTGRLPFEAAGLWALRDLVLKGQPKPPSFHRPDLDAALDAVCLKALACDPAQRFARMADFASALGSGVRSQESGVRRENSPSLTPDSWPLTPGSVRFSFLGRLEPVPPNAAGQNRLFLEVGLDLRPGVVDHHHLTASSISTSSLVLAHPELVAAALIPGRQSADRFTIVMQARPDLDAVTAAWLAMHYLAEGQFPDGADALGRYLDKVNEGSLGMSPAQPFALYAAYRQLGSRLSRQPFNSDHERWQDMVRRGLELVAFVAGKITVEGTPLPDVDAFACPGLFTAADRQEVLDDAVRYRRKLIDPRARARSVRLALPGQLGGTVAVDTLLIRLAPSNRDSDRVLFFRDWARSDAEACPNGRGYVGLCVFLPEGERQPRRAVISVTPGSGASLRRPGGSPR